MVFAASLTNRIFFASAALAVVSIGVAVLVVNAAVTAQAEAELARGLDESAAFVDEYRTTLFEHFSREARLVADLPKLKAAVDTDDPPTVLQLATDYGRQIGADLFVVTGRSGRVLAKTGGAAKLEAIAKTAPQRAAAAHNSGRAEGPHANPPLERPLRDLNGDHPYLVERGLTVPTIKTFGIGFCTRGLMRGRIAIPIHDERGNLVAYAGRAVDGELADAKGKYRLPDGFKKSFVLFNLHRAAEHADRGLIVVEGFFDCFKVHQAGFPNVVALMGSTLSEPQEQLILTHADRLALFLDGDDAGTKCLREFYARASNLFLSILFASSG